MAALMFGRGQRLRCVHLRLRCIDRTQSNYLCITPDSAQNRNPL